MKCRICGKKGFKAAWEVAAHKAKEHPGAPSRREERMTGDGVRGKKKGGMEEFVFRHCPHCGGRLPRVVGF